MKFKAELHRLLGELIAEGIVAKEEFIGVDGVRRVLYWLKEKGESPLHLALVDNTYNLLREFGNARICDTREGPDIIFENIAVECETGLKEDLESFRLQIEKRMKDFEDIWVVCPNEKVAERHMQVVGKVFTIPELRRVLGRGKERL